tara:strand:- start:698 stop:1885 length:1188 start_codon:yes stop_codon:yes gene_type:complete
MNKKKKIKILRIINRFNIGGPTYNATFLTGFLSDQFETLLVGGLPEKGEADSLHILEEYGVKATLLPEMKRKPNFFSDKKALKKLKEIINEYKPDIVHTHASKAGALGRKAAFDCSVPIVLHTFHGHVFHSYFGKVKTRLFRFIEQQLAKRSTGIIAISEIQKKELTETYKICSKSKVRVIPLGFDLEKFRKNKKENRKKIRDQYGLNEDDVVIAIIGRLAPIKNHDFFLDVVKKVSKSRKKNIVFLIVGDGELKDSISKNVDQMKQEGIDIRMTSWVKNINEFNAGMDIICLTSNNEGTPVSLIEAQASGVPVISTDVGGVKNIVNDEQTGFVIKIGDIDTYALKMMLLIDDKNLRNQFSSKGWEYVGNKYNYKNLADNMEKYYLELLSENKVK